MIGSNPVRCEVRNKDQYGRNVSSCSVLTSKGPIDIGNFMVSNGYAVAYRYACRTWLSATPVGKHIPFVWCLQRCFVRVQAAAALKPGNSCMCFQAVWEGLCSSRGCSPPGAQGHVAGHL